MSWFTLGNFDIARIVETEDPFLPPHEMFVEATPETIRPYLGDLGSNGICPRSGKLILPIQSYLVRSHRHMVLVDACVGNDKSHSWFPQWHKRRDRTYLSRMAALGVSPPDIDYVLCTHLHVDHSGWNTRLENGRWVPAFPNARYVFSKPECEYAERLSQKGQDTTFDENVAPIIEAGRAVLVDMDHQIDEQIWLEPTPGHTPGHVAVHLRSGGVKAVITGDLIHSPLQCRHPEWNFVFDSDKPLALRTRRDFLETYSESGVVILTSHFPSPSTGHFRDAGAAFRFEYADLSTGRSVQQVFTSGSGA
jgi:glyoxylase-like metal-dependent hydrolase (beta-lactamase superfamily II)